MAELFEGINTTKLFEDRRSDVGRGAMSAAIEAVQDKLLQSQGIHGKDSPETARLLSVLAWMLFLGERYEEAEELIRSYLVISEKTHGRDSYEMAFGLKLLSCIYEASGISEDASALDRACYSVLNNLGEYIERDPLIEPLYDLSLEYQSQDDSTVGGLKFTFSLMTLSWLVTQYVETARVYVEFLPRVRALFPSERFGEPAWGWLKRRACSIENDFVGLLSVLAEAGMAPGSPVRPKMVGSNEDEDLKLLREINDGKHSFMRAHSVVSIPDHTILEGFAPLFPVSLAEWDLSFRAEQLLAYGCERLRNYWHLNPTLVVVSRSPVHTELNVTQVLVWQHPMLFKEDLARAQAVLKQIVAEFGAYSAMILVEARAGEKVLDTEGEALSEKAIIVMARDANSHLLAVQRYSEKDGAYSFEEPEVDPTSESWLSDYDFPVEPKPPAKPGKKKAKKKNRRK